MNEKFKESFNIFVKHFHQWAVMTKDRPGSMLPKSAPEIVKTKNSEEFKDIAIRKKISADFYGMVTEAIKADILTEDNGKELGKYFVKEFSK